MALNGRRTFALWLHAAAIAAAPLAIGGVHTATAVALLAPTLLAFAVQMGWRSRDGIGYGVPAIGWVLLAWTTVLALQLVPLPPGILAALSPQSATLRHGAAALVGADPRWAPLSLSPPATARDLVRALAALGTALGVAGLVRVRARAAATLLTTVVVTGVALVAIAAVQQILGAESILGFYAPETTQGHRFFWSTFVNQNHFAAFLCLAAPLALGLALDAATPRGRGPLFVAAFAILGIGALLTLSRAGAVVLVGEVALFGALWSTARRSGGAGRAGGGETGTVGWGMIACALTVVLAAGLLVAFPRVVSDWRALGHEDALAAYAKWATWPDAWRLITTFPWTGVGAGAYGEVFPAFNQAFPDYTFHFVENGPLQLAADVGLPAAALLLVPALALGALLLRRSTRRPLLLGASVGVAGLLVENLVDFSIAVPGVTLPAAAVLGVLAGKMRAPSASGAVAGSGDGRTVAGASESLSVAGRRPRARIALAAAGAALLAAAPASWLALGQSLGRSRTAVAEGATGAIEDAAFWHPADPLVAVAAGQRAELAGDVTGAARWFSRARTLAPAGLWPALHELRLALGRSDEAAARAALGALHGAHGAHARERRLYLELLRGRQDIGAIFGPAVDWQPAALVAAVQDLRGLGAGRSSERLLRAALEQRPDDPQLLYSLATLYLSRGRRDDADRVATRLLALHADRAEGYLVLGDLALHRGDAALADHLFREAARLAPDDIQLLFRRADALTRLHEWGPLETVFRELSARTQTARERAHLWTLRSKAAEAQGEAKKALRFAREAVTEMPNDVPHLRQLARLLEALERADSALTVYERILELSKDDRAAAAAITRLRGGPPGATRDDDDAPDP